MYRVVTYPDASAQVAELPTEALPYYAETFGVIELAPWNGRPYNEDYPDGPMRELMFGPHGMGPSLI